MRGFSFLSLIIAVFLSSFQALASDWESITKELKNRSCRITNPSGKMFRHFAITPDGQTIITCDGNEVKLWDFKKGKSLITIAAHEGPFYSVAIDLKRNRIFTSSADASIKIWDFKTGKLLRTLDEKAGVATSMAISSDGKTLVTIDEELNVWDPDTGKLKRNFTHLGYMQNIAVSEDGTKAVTSNISGEITVVDLTKGTQSKHVHRDVISNMIIGPESDQVLSVSQNGIVKIWDPKAGTVKTIKTAEGNYSAIEVSRDGKTLVASSFEDNNNSVRVIDLKSGKTHKIYNNNGELAQIKLNPDHRSILLGTFKGVIQSLPLNLEEIYQSKVKDKPTELESLDFLKIYAQVSDKHRSEIIKRLLALRHHRKVQIELLAFYDDPSVKNYFDFAQKETLAEIMGESLEKLPFEEIYPIRQKKEDAIFSIIEKHSLMDSFLSKFFKPFNSAYKQLSPSDHRKLENLIHTIRLRFKDSLKRSLGKENALVYVTTLEELYQLRRYGVIWRENSDQAFDCSNEEMTRFILQKFLSLQKDSLANQMFKTDQQGRQEIELALEGYRMYLEKCFHKINGSYTRKQLLKWFGRADEDLMLSVKNRAERIAGRDGPGLDREFLAIRERIHNQYEPSILPDTRQFLETRLSEQKQGQDINPTLISELKILVSELEFLFGESSADLTKALNPTGITPPNADPTLTELIPIGQSLQKRLQSPVTTPQQKIGLTTALNAVTDRILVKSHSLVEEAKRTGKLTASMIAQLIDGLNLEGLITDKKREKLLEALEKAKNQATPEQLLGFLKHVFGVGKAQLTEEFQKSMEILGQYFPEVDEFIEDSLRRSLLLRVSQIIHDLEEKKPYEPYVLAQSCGILEIVPTLSDLFKLSDLAQSASDRIYVLGPQVELGRGASFQGVISHEALPAGSHFRVRAEQGSHPKPCARVQGACESNEIQSLNGKPVKLTVEQHGFKLEPLAQLEPRQPASKESIPLKKNLEVRSILNLTDPNSLKYKDAIGAKAAHAAELYAILGEKYTYPALAIPYAHYDDFIEQNGLQDKIKELLQNERFKTDAQYRSQRLSELRNAFINAKLNPVLLRQLSRQMKEVAGTNRYVRFRSSANAEDLEGFSGAGLYESHRAQWDNEREIADAIKNTWASVWTQRAFDAREEAGIDHRNVAMGILVHRNYADEKANGVAFTGLKDRAEMMKVTTQKGKLSVTNPEMSSIPEIIEIKRDQPGIVKSIQTSNVTIGLPVLKRKEIDELTFLMEKIHSYYGRPMDLEFKLMEDSDTNKRQIMIKQARPYDGN